MRIRLAQADGMGDTAKYLKNLLESRGLEINADEYDALICWGWYPGGWRGPVFNKNCSKLNKLGQLRRLAAARVPCIKAYGRQDYDDGVAFTLPVLERKLQHTGGVDIRIIRHWGGGTMMKPATGHFYTKLIPTTTEYRVWVYRNSNLGCYEKRGGGGQFRNEGAGWKHVLMRQGQIPRDAVEVAKKAVAALNLDFGGVDVLRHENGNAIVCEVNTAPGANGPHAQGITLLADHIAEWINDGFPERRVNVQQA